MIPQLGHEFAGQLLNDLEDLELPLLSWGVTTGTLSQQEVVEVVTNRINSEEDLQYDTEDVLDRLEQDGLLFRVPGTSPVRFRTRMAEAIRLATQLRQLWPPKDLLHPDPNWWTRGKPLIADYRLHVTARSYPKRNVEARQANDALASATNSSRVLAKIVEAQIGTLELAGFQVSAAENILSALTQGGPRGVIIGAGTGSGKTKAFYLPAFAAMAEQARPQRHSVHTLALYPRKELLRDQLREAVKTASDLDPIMRSLGRRPIRIGALYGDTPYEADDCSPASRKQNIVEAWQVSKGRDAVCPYLSCPRDGCGNSLVWREADRQRGEEILRCHASTCSVVLTNVALTRKSLRHQPPDILFTTTEMLNRQATNLNLGPLLGWRGGQQPALVLLDEVHTYSGVHGAQVALLLRRWRHSGHRRTTFVGLSATLRDAVPFFAQLTGLDQSDVDYIEPAPEDLEYQGREYSLALRGDPISGAGLLSTSIQTAMLFGRVMDPRNHEHIHGSRGFLFTDDLDVTNRFYDDLRDAEGMRRRGRGRPGTVLAGLRASDGEYQAERYPDGQSWDLVERIGHVLDPACQVNGLKIGRTSSQDAGVDRDADLIVATASLEVGFNDPAVGLVLQHKAPHDAAAFIQRRGRAGRLRRTRPWTVVTLSDYGRDRFVYQAYESLFAPEVPPRRLPINNRFVLKMQGVQTLLDWMAAQLSDKGIYADPRGLMQPGKHNDSHLVAFQSLLETLLDDRKLQDSLTRYLSKALDVSSEEALAVMWEPPRALMTAVVPTGLRRIRCRWNPVKEDPGANQSYPLSEFMTEALFAALNVPEVDLHLHWGGKPERMELDRALREAVPGRVSRRFGHRNSHHRTWLPMPQNEFGQLELEQLVPAPHREGKWHAHGEQAIEVIRPYVIKLQDPPEAVADSSNAYPVWGSEFLESDAPCYLAHVPDPSAWSGKVSHVGFATHAAGNPVEVRRMTFGCEATVVDQQGRRPLQKVTYLHGGVPVAIGFKLTADAIRFTVAPLDTDDAEVKRHLRSPGWRTLAFTASVAQAEALDGIANTFQRDWLSLVYLTAYALTGLNGKESEQVHHLLRRGAWRDQLADVLAVLYRDDDASNAPQSLIDALTNLSHNETVTECLDKYGELLFIPDVEGRTSDLARRTYWDTVGAAVLAAALRACPDAQEQDLIVDVLAPSTAHEPATIWLSETSLGGLGIIEQLQDFYGSDPRRFWGLVDNALGPSDHEYVDSTLSKLLYHVQDEPTGAIGRAMVAIRQAPTAHAAADALEDLRAGWETLDGYPRHTAMAALSTRLLRPGADRTTDLDTLAVLRAWDELERSLGFEINAKVIAYAIGSNKLVPEGMRHARSADQVFSMLWPRGSEARAQNLRHYQPYQRSQVLDRKLVAAATSVDLKRVDVQSPEWQDEYVSAAITDGAVLLVASSSASSALARAIREVSALRVDRGFLRVYGEVKQVIRVGSEIQAVVGIREAEQ